MDEVGWRSMRVLHVVDSLGAGGMENGVVNVANRLSGQVDSWAGALSVRGDFADRMPVPGQVIALNKASGFSLRVALRLSRLVRRIEPDVIHTHNLGPLLYVAVARLLNWPWRKWPPIVHGEHSMLEGEELSLRRLLQRRYFYRGCAVVHTVSKGLLEALQTEGLYAKRMIAIINGVDGERFCPAPDRGEDRTLKRIVIGIVGRLVERKRHAMLVKAFARIAQDFPTCELLIVGDKGPAREKIAAEIRECRYRNRIKWLPFQTRPEEFYQQMDLLVVPSESEGLPNVVLEAMACGVAVAGSFACGIPEVVDDHRTGFLGRIDDVDDLEQLLRRALSAGGGELFEMGRRAREEVTQQFTLSAMADSYHRLYASVAS